MEPFLLVKYLHLVSIFTMIACLSVELVLLRMVMTRSEIRRLSRVDAIYGMSAIAAVIAGLTMWFGVGKGAAFYNNPILFLKVGLVLIVGLISIVPTVFFIRQAKGDQMETMTIPARIRKLVILQLFIMAIIPLLATMVANGLRF